MNRPLGWKTNPQALAAVSKRSEYCGNPELATVVDGDTWLTPRWILNELGPFDLDPCPVDAQQDGLAMEWTGRVFMNPPFSNTAPWLSKHSLHGLGISLVPASVESVIWRKVVWPKAKAILLLHGRTRFCNPDGSVTTGRPLRSVSLIAWSEHDAKILAESAIAGVLLSQWNQR